jgi:hypothetical protein
MFPSGLIHGNESRNKYFVVKQVSTDTMNLARIINIHTQSLWEVRVRTLR